MSDKHLSRSGNDGHKTAEFSAVAAERSIKKALVRGVWFYIPVTGAAEVQLRIFALFVTISYVVEQFLVGIVVYLYLGMSKMESFY